MLTAAAAPAVAGVECDRTKQYQLRSINGPWMIMVAAIHPLHGGDATKGMSPAEAALQVVYDLREQGIPAYTYAIDTETQSLSARGASGQDREMLMATMHGGVCVLAGNFQSADDPSVKRCLKDVKKKVRCPTLEPVKATGGLAMTRTGGFFQVTPGRPRSPLTRAFITVNPLLSAEQVRRLRKIRDPLLTGLNSGEEYSLHKCPGRYSVVVKEFRGRTLTQVSGTKSEDVAERVDVSGDLSDAAREAWELCQILREREGREAYVWHDQHRSVVTVGSFRSASDPAAVRTAREFAARPSATGGTQAYVVAVPKDAKGILDAERFWLLEPSPYAIAVPNL